MIEPQMVSIHQTMIFEYLKRSHIQVGKSKVGMLRISMSHVLPFPRRIYLHIPTSSAASIKLWY